MALVSVHQASACGVELEGRVPLEGGELFVRGEQHVQELGLLQLLGPAQRADDDWVQAPRGSEVRHRFHGQFIVSGDEDVQLLARNLATGQGTGKGGVERLDDFRSGELLKFLRGRATSRDGEALEGRGVDRVRDIHIDLAVQGGSVPGEDVLGRLEDTAGTTMEPVMVSPATPVLTCPPRSEDRASALALSS